MYVPLLLNTTSTNGQQNNTFLDSSSNAFTITRNGTPTQGSFTPYQPSGYWSGYFNGTSDYLSVASNAAFAFGTGDFTVECWVYQSTLAAAVLTDLRGAVSVVAPSFELNGTGKLLIYKEGTGTLITSSSSISAGTWNHVAFTRNGTTVRLFVNGALDATTVTDSTSWATPTTKINIGSSYVPSGYLNGYISNLRVVKGTAVYATNTNFTPPITDLTTVTNTQLLTLLSTTSTVIRDVSTNTFSIGLVGSPVLAVSYFLPPITTSSLVTSSLLLDSDFTIDC
jgi:hypothetical protein